MRVKVQVCPLAKKHHKESSRQFAHVLHKRNTICVTPEFYDLPKHYQVGILMHEFGHLILKEKKHSESQADSIIWEHYGIGIDRRNYQGMPKLEYIGKKYYAAALEFLGLNLSE